MSGVPDDIDSHTRERYASPDAARRYVRELDHPVAKAITRGERRAVQACVTALGGLDEPATGAVWLDLAGGSGKLGEGVVTHRRISLDVSYDMLMLDTSNSPRIQGDARCIPIAEDSVRLVVVLRLLHRCSDAMVIRVVQEGLRVSIDGVVLSDMTSTPSWRSLVRQSLGRTPEQGGRTRAHLRDLVGQAGGVVIADVQTLPTLSGGHVIAVQRRSDAWGVEAPGSSCWSARGADRTASVQPRGGAGSGHDRHRHGPSAGRGR